MRFFTDSIQYHGTIHQSNRDLPYLFMLHGFMGSEKAFDHLIKPLNEFCNPFTIDLAGHGKTKTPVQPELFSTVRQCGQLFSILNRLQFENLYIYGYSMGGRMAFQMISRHPEMFKGAVIESAHCGIPDVLERKKRKITDMDCANNIEENYNQFLDDWQSLPLFKHTPSSQKKMYRDIMDAQNPELMAASLRGFGAGIMPSVCDELKNIPIPIKLIAGEYDIKYAELYTSLKKISPTIELTIIDKAGHRVHADKPDEVVLAIKNFITKNN